MNDLVVVVPEMELQISTTGGEFTSLARASITAGRLRDLLHAPAIGALRVARKWGCVGVGWRSMPELERNVAEFDLTAESWASEEHLIEYVGTFLNEGGVAASRLLQAARIAR